MRLKHKPQAKPFLLSSTICIQNPQDCKGKWNLSFSNNNPIFIEIGCGKGQFILNNALNNPHINYIGIEQYESVLYSAIKKCGENPPSNLKFICFRAEYISDIFSVGEVSKIYLNFSDPWPKKRHAKRRLTSDRFLGLYKEVLMPMGTIEMKTDNDSLFDFSLEQLNTYPDFNILSFTNDLYSDPLLLKDNIPTEYEEKFRQNGKNINKLTASLIKNE